MESRTVEVTRRDSVAPERQSLPTLDAAGAMAISLEQDQATVDCGQSTALEITLAGTIFTGSRTRL